MVSNGAAALIAAVIVRYCAPWQGVFGCPTVRVLAAPRDAETNKRENQAEKGSAMRDQLHHSSSNCERFGAAHGQFWGWRYQSAVFSARIFLEHAND